MVDRKFKYEGRDLEAMSFAENYHRWIINEFKPYAGKKFVEVGAGSGSVSQLLLELRPDKFTAVEPSEEMFPLLKQRFEKNSVVDLHQAFFVDVQKPIKRKGVDSFFYVNVLEHIPDDKTELQAVYNTLPLDGKLFIFVPAGKALFSDFDKKLGHYRRYHKKELENLCKNAGFKVLKSSYFDIVGTIPWLINYRWRKSTDMAPKAVKLYDNAVVPIMKPIEAVLPVPFGKNILLIAEKNG